VTFVMRYLEKKAFDNLTINILAINGRLIF